MHISSEIPRTAGPGDSICVWILAFKRKFKLRLRLFSKLKSKKKKRKFRVNYIYCQKVVTKKVPDYRHTVL